MIVTADHAHTSQIVDGNTPGLTAKLATKEGSDMIVAYGTAAAGGSQQHTGTQLRVAGYGPGAANLVGLIDQTDLHFIIRQAPVRSCGPLSRRTPGVTTTAPVLVATAISPGLTAIW